MRQVDKLPQATELRRAVERALEDKLRTGASGRRGIEVDLGNGRPAKRVHIERELRDTLATIKGQWLGPLKAYWIMVGQRRGDLSELWARRPSSG
jgi:hypothetical protein